MSKHIKCRCCGRPQRIRKVGRMLLSNINRALQACGDCIMKGLA